MKNKIVSIALLVLLLSVSVFAQVGQWTVGDPGVQAGRLLFYGSTSGSFRLETATATATGLKAGSGTIAGTGNIGGFNVGCGTDCYVDVSNGTTMVYMWSDSGGNGVGTFTNHDFQLRTNNITRQTLSTAGAFRWHAYGAGTLTTDASGNITAVSDERRKFVLRPFQAGLREILKLNAVEYKWRPESGMETKGTYASLTAQSVRAAIPLASGQNPDGTLTVQDRAIVAALVNAIKDQQAEIEGLRREISLRR